MSKTIKDYNWSFSLNKGFYKVYYYRTGECADYARLQVAQGSNGKYTAVGADNTLSIYEKSDSSKSKNIQKGINLIIKNLKQGRAVMVGVMYKRDEGAGNSGNKSTNHYVTIVGMGKDDKGIYFSYYDNYTGEGPVEQTNKNVGTDIEKNKFRLNKASDGSYYLSDGGDGSIPYNQNKPPNKYQYKNYIITEVRDNK